MIILSQQLIKSCTNLTILLSVILTDHFTLILDLLPLLIIYITDNSAFSFFIYPREQIDKDGPVSF